MRQSCSLTAGRYIWPASSWIGLETRMLQPGDAQLVYDVQGMHAEGCPAPAGRIPARVLCVGLLRGGRAPAARVLQQHHAAERACAVPARGVNAAAVPACAAARGLRRSQAGMRCASAAHFASAVQCMCTMVGLDARDALYIVYCMADHMSAAPLHASICLPACAKNCVRGVRPCLDCWFHSFRGT